LFAALVAVQAQRAEGVETLLKSLPGHDPHGKEAALRLSSLFPWVGELLFFPRPRLKVNLGEGDSEGSSKLFKKTAYVSEGILQDLLNPKKESMAQEWKRGLFLQKNSFWMKEQERERLPQAWQTLSRDALAVQQVFCTERVTRVSVDRQSQFSSVYLVARTSWSADCGLWLMVEAEAQRQAQVASLLAELGERGIGAERSSGYGGFTLKALPLSQWLSRPTQGKGHGLLLSRYNPTTAELEAGVLKGNASYELVDVGGWFYAQGQRAQRRQRLRLIEAGSVLNVSAAALHGRLVDVRPVPDFPHPVYRSGLALTL